MVNWRVFCAEFAPPAVTEALTSVRCSDCTCNGRCTCDRSVVVLSDCPTSFPKICGFNRRTVGPTFGSFGSAPMGYKFAFSNNTSTWHGVPISHQQARFFPRNSSTSLVVNGCASFSFLNQSTACCWVAIKVNRPGVRAAISALNAWHHVIPAKPKANQPPILNGFPMRVGRAQFTAGSPLSAWLAAWRLNPLFRLN